MGIKTPVADNEHTATLSAVGVLPSDFTGLRLLAFVGALPSAHRLPDAGVVVVGRGDDVDVRIDDRSLSRRHASIEVRGDVITVADAGSTNGTRVRGARIDGESVVALGEVFHLGHVTCAVEAVSAGARGSAQTQRPTLSDAPSGAPSGAQSAKGKLDAMVGLVANSALSVLLHGETGSGKEVTARAIHERSGRKAGPFLALNCAALPETLLESELFGYERGAFSGADKAKPGLFESADGGTVFLDEVAEMSAAVQAKLLRVLESRQVQRLGAMRPLNIDVRFVSASHKDLQDEVDVGRFREDLYFRLNGITIELPPLRERSDEILALASQFLAAAAATTTSAAPKVSSAAQALLLAHSWPGNIRELKTVMERAVVLCAGADVVDVAHVMIDKPRGPRGALAVSTAKASAGEASSSAAVRAATVPLDAKQQAERTRIIEALQAAAGNQGKAAELLGVSRRTLINRIEQYDVPRPRKG